MKKLALTLGLIAGLSANAAFDPCKDDGLQDGSDLLALVSKEDGHKLKKSFSPEVVNAPTQLHIPRTMQDVLRQKGKPASISTVQLRPEALAQFQKMHDDAAALGLNFYLFSGYRGFVTQCSTYKSKFDKFSKQYPVEADLIKYVNNISALPGRSEHQLGTTFDMVFESLMNLGKTLSYPDEGGRCTNGKCPDVDWVLANAHKYGFAMSYPRLPGAKSDYNPVTQYNYESWHWRYLGVEAATELFNISTQLNRRVSVLEYIKYKKNLIPFEDLQNPKPVARAPQSVAQEIVIGMGGDVSLSQPGSTNLSDKGSSFGGKFATWEQMGQGLKQMTDGNDLNFMNLESVVSTKNLKAIDGKKYPQISHPVGVDYLVNQVGFNMVSSANNHAYDYDQTGIEETLGNLKLIQERSKGKMTMSGLGTLDQTMNPQIIELNGLRIAYVAVGMKGDDRPHWEKTWRPTEGTNGMLSVRYCKDGSVEQAMKPCNEYGDLKQVLENLKNTAADLRIVSIHEGMELSVYTKNGSKPDDDTKETKDGKQRQRSENRNIEAKMILIKSYGIDMVIGHHTHNVRPIEYNGKTIAMYSLGNLLFLGGKNYSSNEFPLWNRFGLFVKNYFSYVNGKLQLSASQIIPTKNSHITPTIWDAANANKFVDFLNAASSKSLGATGIQYKSLNDGTAVFCVPNVEKGPKASKICGS